ncbi:MAG: I78 family peptidase inhibitor [Maricaulaceae bacterium]|jgi:hypothetical protein
MKTTLTALAAGLLAGCAVLTGDIDDGGRAYEQTNNAPVHSNIEPTAAEPTIEIINARPRPAGGGSGGGGASSTSTCDLERWERLMGQPRANVVSQDLPESVRVISYGSMVTQDFVPERLNIWLDRNDNVYRVTCG